MTEKERTTLEQFVGKTLTGFHQEPETPRSPGDWQDDWPLELRFDDGSVLEVSAGGFHQSGALYVDAKKLVRA